MRITQSPVLIVASGLLWNKPLANTHSLINFPLISDFSNILAFSCPKAIRILPHPGELPILPSDLMNLIRLFKNKHCTCMLEDDILKHLTIASIVY